MSRPSFQWYPDNWLHDLGLRRCSTLARAVWMDMICLMHQGEPYGHLSRSGEKLPMEFIANQCSVSPAKLKAAIKELEHHKVFSRTEDGTIYSRRMVKDEKIRIARAAGGIKGGNPTLKVNLRGKPPTHEGVNLHAGEGEGEVLSKEPSEEEKRFWISKTMLEFPGAKVLGKLPDERIVNQCFDLVNGDMEVLGRAFRALHLTGQKPSISWGWFPKVLPRYLEKGQ